MNTEQKSRLEALIEFSKKGPDLKFLKKQAEREFLKLAGLSMYDWPEHLKKLSIPFEVYNIPKPIHDLMLGIFDGENKQEIIKFFEETLEDSEFKDSFFFKFESRSNKDTWNPWLPYSINNIKRLVDDISGSERCIDDLVMAHKLKREFKFIIRPYWRIENDSEFRVYVAKDRIVGISQYHYDKHFDLPEFRLTDIKNKIYKLFVTHIQGKMAQDYYVLDFFVDKQSLDVVLLETNPYGLSDPCLFRSYDNLDSSFLYTKSTKL